MTITMTLEKKEKNLPEDVATIRFLSKLIENLVAAFSAVTLVTFYFINGQGQGTTRIQWKLWYFS